MTSSNKVFFAAVTLGFVLLCCGVKEEHVAHSPGSQKHLTETGEHNPHYDHEAVLGSRKLEEEFDELTPEEAKKRLHALALKMDRNDDQFVTLEELTAWIIHSYRLLDEEEALEEMAEQDEDKDNLISWKEYLHSQFSYNEADIKDFRNNPKEEIQQFLEIVDEDEKKFVKADIDKDGYLNKGEYIAFYHPYAYEHMHDIELSRTLRDNDKDGDGFISKKEFLGEGHHDREWEIVEEERFKEYDINKDNLLNYDEIRPWVLQDNSEIARDEAEHLMRTADTNKDSKLSIDEIVDHHEDFVGSQATDYGRHLHIFQDEL
ncbi:hypothetical protein ACJMK2_041820 [Sinanodonta woodiana]|uniref:Reticulocalbin-3 n=1 Tax=Sinanodonta woodiana TaxID=1069815 RepID=A0ABD3W5E0_SINWO